MKRYFPCIATTVRHQRTAGSSWRVLLISLALLPGAVLPATGQGFYSLRELERRALRAQALEDELGELRTSLTEAMETLRNTEDQVKAVWDKISGHQAEMNKLTARVAELQAELAERDDLLKSLQSGDFEYYEVQEGDTLELIAANPLIYGDARRAAWIEQANDLRPGARLRPHTVLIIPRYGGRLETGL